jgi:hypothetical protein
MVFSFQILRRAQQTTIAARFGPVTQERVLPRTTTTSSTTSFKQLEMRISGGRIPALQEISYLALETICGEIGD